MGRGEEEPGAVAFSADVTERAATADGFEDRAELGVTRETHHLVDATALGG